ncbi:MAG: hypothetical protein AAB262_14740 [Elusimicrobiota bacterium]
MTAQANQLRAPATVNLPLPGRHASARTRELFQALAALRSTPNPPSVENARHWAVVDRYVRVAIGGRGPDAEDDRQDVLLAIVAHASAMRAETPVSAAAWVKAICHRVRADRERGRRRARHVSIDDLDQRVQLAGSECVCPDLVEAVLASFEAEVVVHLTVPIGAARRRDLRLLQARMAIRRLALGESHGAIARVLGCPASADLVSKWVERGRAVVASTVSGLAASDPDAAALYAPFAELAALRRSDHGVPRPSRRRGAIAATN